MSNEGTTTTELETALEPLLQALVDDGDGPRVAAVGGGHGLAQALEAVQTYAGDIAAIVGVADDGGSSGRLAPAMEIPPPGDIRKCLIALTPERSVSRALFQHRFGDGDIAGHSLGNLILAALADINGGFEEALQAAERLLGTVGTVIPAAPQRLQLEAIVDGRIVEGQVNVSRSRGSISKLRVSPDVVANVRALEAIERAEQIVLGPGSLYTSVIATLLVPGIVEAINRSEARLVFVLNLITQDGESLSMDAGEHIEALLRLSGIRPPSTIVANSAPISIDSPLAPVVVEAGVIETYGSDVMLVDLLDRAATWPVHDPVLLGRALRELV